MKIVYRIVAALLALAIIPSVYFLSFLYYSFDAALVYVADEVYVKDVIEMVKDDTESIKKFFSGDGNFLSSHGAQQIKPSLISFAVFFTLALLLSIVIFFFAVFSNKRILITGLGGLGLAFMGAAYLSFGKLADLLTSGKVPLSSFFDTEGFSFLIKMGIQMAGGLMGLKTLRLTSAPLIITLLFAAIVVWGLAFILTEDDKEKAERKLKKAKH
ncbi:MAG TPA: hypothetical protein PKW24_06865 [Clostridiales bacterium]|jgi:hypothetical protein|nr:hypothetical protein [Clostridiales bacterium]HRT82464.1 hypothetical protein [Oscillospiraceae bacterium]